MSNPLTVTTELLDTLRDTAEKWKLRAAAAEAEVAALKSENARLSEILHMDVPLTEAKADALSWQRQCEDARNFALSKSAEVAALKSELDAAWKAIERGWDIEPREYFEKEAPKNGFISPLAQAVHHMWKRHAKEWPNEELKARQSREARAEK